MGLEELLVLDEEMTPITATHINDLWNVRYCLLAYVRPIDLIYGRRH
jgi:hypothetical protein